MFNPETLANQLSEIGTLHISESKKGTFHGFVDGIQVTWLRYPNPLLDELTNSSVVPGLRIASILDIAVMKWAAISDRGSRKDFIDLYFICSTSGLTLESLVPIHSKKFPEAHINYYHMLKSLSYFDDAEEEGWPVMLQSVNWNDIKFFFIENQKKLMKQLLL